MMAKIPEKLQGRINALATKSSERFPEKKTIEKKHKNKKNLPLVSEDKRVAPNVILRSSLFGVVKRGRRGYEESVIKATLSGFTVRFTGKKLDQADFDVYLECIRRCSKEPLGEMVCFSAYDFLSSIGRSSGKTQYDWLKESLLRLSANAVEIGDDSFFYRGSLINEEYRNEKTGSFVIKLNPKISVLFTGNLWTGVSFIERTKLKGKQLAQWLHGFFCTHAHPFPYKVETLKSLCGSDVKSLKTFKQNLKKALDELSSATGWKCWVDQNDLVNVTKSVGIS